MALGAAFAAVAFGAKGGSEVVRTATTEAAILVAAGLVIAAGVAWGRGGRLDGALTFLLVAGLAALGLVSVAWSVAPELSWLEGFKTLAYLAVLGAGMAAARLSPRSWTLVLKGILVAAAAVVGYSLASRVWPGTLADTEIYARIGKPYDYWNAVGITAALAVPPTLWLGARRSGHPPLNALAFPLLGVLLVALMLSYSRGSLAAAVIGVALWLAFVPLRLRSLTVLATAIAGAAPVVLWALSRDAFTMDGIPLAVRESVGGEFGLLLLAMVAALLAAGLAIGFRASRSAPSARLRRRVGLAAAVGAMLLPLVAFGSVAMSDRGIGGTFSELTSSEETTSGGPERLTSTASTRSRYWGQAADIFAENRMKGSGVGTFGVARLRHRDGPAVARHAHGYVAQTASDLGMLGLMLSMLAVMAWLAVATRTVGARRGPHLLPFDAERVGLTALGLAALVFGLQSAIDWTWFVPGPTVMALAAAGFVAGRGTIGILNPSAAAPAAAGAPSELERERPFATPPADGSRSPRALLTGLRRTGRVRAIAGGAVVLVALASAWAAWQPARADRAGDRALAALADGDIAHAAREARAARDINPLALKPLFVSAAVLREGGRPQQAEALLEQAVAEHAAEPEAWLRLASFQLRELNEPAAAVRTLQGALYLDPHSRAAQSLFFEARAQLAPGATVTTAP